MLAGLLAISLILGGLEAAVRLWGSGRYEPYPMDHAPATDPMFVHDPDLYWRALPNFRQEGHPFSTNSLGLRDDEFPAPGGGQRLAVLCLGDSSTWGDGVQAREAYPGLLERALQKDVRAAGKRVEVLNAGVPGYSAWQILRQQRQLMARFRFDVVTIAALNSDMMPARRTDRAYALEGVFGAVFRVAYSSELFRFTRSWLTRAQGEPVGYEANFLPRVPARPDYHELLGQMVALARERKAAVVLVEPFPICRHAHCKELERQMGPISPAMEAMSARMHQVAAGYHEAMRAVSREQGIPLADMPAALRGQATPWLHYADSIHPNTRGHRLMARVLAARVRSLLEAGHRATSR